MGRRNNGLSKQWAVGIMGCRNNGSSELWAVGIMTHNRQKPPAGMGYQTANLILSAIYMAKMEFEIIS